MASLLRAGLALVLGLCLTLSALAGSPLHERIDQILAADTPDFARQAAPPADDAEFLRRVCLDLTGCIPTAADARAFLADASPGKRAALIDRLLASPEHARHMQHVYDVILMERRPDKNVPRAAWQEFLFASFSANKPYDQFVAELLSADGADPKNRGPAKFLLDRDAEPHLLTRDVSRLFLGMNLRCAQCHDHPLVDAYKQDHYYGLFAFFNRTTLVTDKSKVAALAEKADGEVSFQSVFDPQKLTKTSLPRVPGGQAIKDPELEKGQEYEVAPAAGVRHVPKYSRRSHLAEQVATAENVQFRRAAANRFWALMMGRGLVHPLDMDHPNNPPSHPELLTLLADEFAATKFDVRGFLRELALSEAYQRSSTLPEGVEAEADRFLAANLKPLSPEQLAWSVMQASGLTDAERLALKDKATEAALYAKLAGNVAPFVAAFGARPGQTEGFEATLEQALFLRNGDLIRGWLAARPGNLLDRLSKLTKAEDVAEELFLSVLTRRPTDDEKKDVAEYLKGRDADRTAALGDLAWALLTSAEFRFNH